MNLLSIEVAGFTAAVAVLRFKAPARAQPWVLGGASLVFCALSDWRDLWTLVALSTAVYWLALIVERSTGPARRAALVVGTALAVGLLLATRLVEDGPLHPAPLGLAFYSLRLVSYLVDVHRATVPAERHFGRFLAFVALFVEIGSGPIERARQLLPQLHERPSFDDSAVSGGLIRITWGVLKKTVVADRLAASVAVVYGRPADFSGLVLLMATLAFAVQIYLDFSGYADIVIGAGRVMGLRLTENFNRPYFARSLAEFWTRWHVSLSSWLRDYVFLPVAFACDRRLSVSRLRTQAADRLSYGTAALATMLLAGLWHGAGWTYVTWGALIGVLMAGARTTAPWRNRLWRTAGLGPDAPLRRVTAVLSTFAIVCATWVVFRSDTLHDAGTILTRIIGWAAGPSGGSWPAGGLAELGLGRSGAAICAAYVAVVLVVDLVTEVTQTDALDGLRHQPLVFRWACYYVLLGSVLLFAAQGRQFIYAQF